MASGTWERVSEEGGILTHRLRVADGWLYRVTTSDPAGMTLAFAPAASGAGTGSVMTPSDTASNDTASAEGDQATEHIPRLDD